MAIETATEKQRKILKKFGYRTDVSAFMAWVTIADIREAGWKVPKAERLQRRAERLQRRTERRKSKGKTHKKPSRKKSRSRRPAPPLPKYPPAPNPNALAPWEDAGIVCAACDARPETKADDDFWSLKRIYLCGDCVHELCGDYLRDNNHRPAGADG